MEKEIIWKKIKMKTILAEITINKHEPWSFVWFKDADFKIEDCNPVLDFITVSTPYRRDDVIINVISECFSEIRCEKMEKESKCDNYRLYGTILFDIEELTDVQLRALEESYFEVYYYIRFENEEGIKIERELDWDFNGNYNVRLELH